MMCTNGTATCVSSDAERDFSRVQGELQDHEQRLRDLENGHGR